MTKSSDKLPSRSTLLRHGIKWPSMLLLSLLSMSACVSRPVPAPCPVLQPAPADLMQSPTYRKQWDKRVTISVPSQTTSLTKPTPK